MFFVDMSVFQPGLLSSKKNHDERRMRKKLLNIWFGSQYSFSTDIIRFPDFKSLVLSKIVNYSRNISKCLKIRFMEHRKQRDYDRTIFQWFQKAMT